MMKETKFTCIKHVNYPGNDSIWDILSCNDFVFIFNFAMHYNSQNNESDHFSSIIRLCPKYPENETLCALYGGFLNENPDQHFLHTISNR